MTQQQQQRRKHGRRVQQQQQQQQHGNGSGQYDHHDPNHHEASRCSRSSSSSSSNDGEGGEILLQQQAKAKEDKEQQQSSWWKLGLFLSVLVFDTITSVLLFTPLVPSLAKEEGLTESSKSYYSMHGTLWDLALLSIPRVVFAILAISISYHRLQSPVSESPPLFDLYHENGLRKSKEELEAEALEEPFVPKLKRYFLRLSFLCEVFVFITGVLLAVKCLSRLNVEIGILDESEPNHPLFWIALGFTALFSIIECVYIDSVEKIACELGQKRRVQLELERQSSSSHHDDGGGGSTWVERISESLTQPLLSRVHSEADVIKNGGGDDTSGSTSDEENGGHHHHEQQGLAAAANNGKEHDDEGKGDGDDGNKQNNYNNARGGPQSGGGTSTGIIISGDTDYSANFSDLLLVASPDTYLIVLASLFLLASAIANVYVPKFTGEILDALVAHSSDNKMANNATTAATAGLLSSSNTGSIVKIPGFMKNIELLVTASVLGGVFGGIRQAIFSVVGARVNVRLRIKLMDSLLSQEIGFYDTTRTGDITSRLSSDTTVVGSAVTNNVNTFLRSIVRAVGVLIFMFVISWQLSMLAFMTIPVVSVLSKWYGRYLRRLTKLQRKKLAEGNSVSEASISSMATVRAFGAEAVELFEFERCMEKYVTLNVRSATATFGYGTCVGCLPQLVKALVLFYGGLLVQSDGPHHITGGQLVSFILYLNSLSEAFNSLGGIYASLVRAVGAADKVFELLHRKPQLTTPSHVDTDSVTAAVQNKKNKHLLGVESTKVIEQRAAGMYPENTNGEITFRNVEFRYPARPQRVVLNDMNLTIPAGSIVALVGSSGSGKSSVVKLIQHLYEPCTGDVSIDGVPVHELSADWICRNVAVVSQEPTLFARSVKRNIIYGLEGTDEEPSREDIEEAATLANAASFIEALPQKYDTEVGERGIQLSGGQKQRVAIARALVRRPRVLLLDEATCALDSESEHVVQEAIDKMITGQRSLNGDPSQSMTVVIVAHRLSTVRNADCIFVVQDGRVIEHGSHEELIEGKADGVYAGLIHRQLKQMGTNNSG